MTIPKIVQGLAGPIRVRWVDDFDTDADMWGLSSFIKREIILRRGMDPVQLRIVFFHELFHFALYDSGQAQELNRETEERLCNLVGSMMSRTALVPFTE